MLRGMLASVLLLSAALVQSTNAVCSSGDSICHDISTQAECSEVTEGPTSDCRWPAGLNTNVDQIVLNGEIVAYQIQWFSGEWSGWYVTGVNDIDWKFNLNSRTCSVPFKSNSMRRMWSYFYDHTHRYIICSNT